MAQKTIQKKEVDYVCTCCGKHYSTLRKNFSPSNSEIYANNDGCLTVCKECVDAVYDKYVEFFNGDEKRAIDRICQIFDFYYNDSVAEASEKRVANRSRISAYLSKIQLKPHTGKTYKDTIKENVNDAESIRSAEDLENYDGDMNERQIKKAVRVWGLGFSPEEYNILNEQFDDWKSRVVIDSKTRESLVRELCSIKLQMNNAIINHDSDLYTKLMGVYQSTMKTANLQPIQVDANDKASEKPIGVMIQMFENERPISEPRKEWKDVDGIVRYITIYFLGHLCKMLNIKNRYSKLYEDEMDKYRVEVPELEEADDEEVFDFLINRNGGDSDGEE